MSEENLEKTSIDSVKKKVDKIIAEAENKEVTSSEEFNTNERKEEGDWKEKVLAENPELSDFEKEQVETGWNPKGDKTAEEWQSNAEFRDTVKKRGKEIKSLKKIIAQQNERLAKIENEAYERAKQELLAAKQYAVQSNDVGKATEIDRRINELPNPTNNQVPQPVLEFMETHSDWLEGDKGIHLEMQLYTSQMDNALAKKGYSPEQHMQKLDEIVREKFNSYFNSTSNVDDEEVEVRAKRATVASDDFTSSVVTKSKAKFDARSLTEEEKDVLKQVERSGVMAKEDYLKKLYEVKQ